MLSELKVSDFMASLAGDSSSPGGGSVAAMSGAAAAGLIAMVASLTVGKHGYENVTDQMSTIKLKMDDAIIWFQKYMDLDAASYAKVIECYKLPKSYESEIEFRNHAIQEALINAALVPISIAKKALSLFPFAADVIKKGNKNAATDGAVAAIMARGAVLSALCNARVNAKGIKDKKLQNELLNEAALLEREAAAEEKRVLSV